MAQTIVKDVVIWAKHIHGDGELAAKLSQLRGGETVELEVDGVRGVWRKMSDGKDGRPTTGLRPIGKMQEFWRELYASRRGEVVSIKTPEGRPAGKETPTIYPALARSEEERQAALQALLSMAGEGYSSNGWRFNRDELYDRDAE